MSELNDEHLDRLASAVHDATRCNCDSGYGDRLVAEAIAPTITEMLAEAWWAGHMTYRRLGPDNCHCSAWNESECGCGEYGSNVITPNPYREAKA